MEIFGSLMKHLTSKNSGKMALERLVLMLFFTATLTSGQAIAGPEDVKQASEKESEAQDENAQLPPQPIVVQVTGYAHYEAKEDGASDPKRLLAIRASRLDAYRNLAERIYGISVSGQSQVRDFVLQNDYFSVRLDTVIRGAHVVSISENKKTGIETVLELSLPGDFAECLNKVNSFKASNDCFQPVGANVSTNSDSGSVASLRAPMSQQYYLK